MRMLCAVALVVACGPEPMVSGRDAGHDGGGASACPCDAGGHPISAPHGTCSRTNTVGPPDVRCFDPPPHDFWWVESPKACGATGSNYSWITACTQYAGGCYPTVEENTIACQ